MASGTDRRQRKTSRKLTRHCAICGGRFHTHWPRQRHCTPCWERWDIRWCPDGHEHVWTPAGHATADMGPLEGALIALAECDRCGVWSMSGITVDQYFAHRHWNEQRKGGR